MRTAGGHHLSWQWTCHEDIAPTDALATALDLTTLVPDIGGPLCIGQPRLCQLLIETAADAGATVRRSVTDVRRP